MLYKIISSVEMNTSLMFRYSYRTLKYIKVEYTVLIRAIQYLST